MKKYLRSVLNHKPAIIFLLIAGLFILDPTAMAQDFSSYHSYDEMTSELKSIVNANKEIAKLESIGKTLQGRDLWLLTIANPAGTPVDKRPGMLIGGNFEGDHLIGSELSLSIIKNLLGSYATDEHVKNSIDEHVLYIIPRMNPDGAENMFASLKTGSKTNTFKYDGDNDGRMDEDGPEDLNKDGYITMMRVKAGDGKYMTDKADPRLMKEADPAKGEAGVYKIYWEGIDNDKDGFINEDPAGGVDINRNFQHAYPYHQEDAGWHMVSEKESIALMDWTLKHKNISIMLIFGESDNLIVSPNQKGKLSTDAGIDLINIANESYKEALKVGMVSTSSRSGFFRMGRRGQGSQARAEFQTGRKIIIDVNTADLDYFTKAGTKYRELTGINTQPPLRKPAGAFFELGYYQYGVLAFSTPGWGLDAEGESKQENRRPSPAARPGAKAAGLDKKMLDYFKKENVEGFVDWEEFTHPELGLVEIGGFIPYATTNPESDKIEDLGKSHSEFVVWLSGLYADINIVNTEVVDHGGGIFRIKAEIENSGFLPTSLSHGVTSRSVSPTMVQLGVDPESIVSGSAKTSFFQALDGSGAREKYEWLIKGKSGDKIELKVVSQKAGTDTQIITLK